MCPPGKESVIQSLCPSKEERIDLVLGSNHGKGAFQCGAKIILTETKSFGFEISVAVIIFWKDSTEVIKKSILTELTKGLKLMAE